MSAPPGHISTEDLSAYLDGAVRDAERDAIAAHLAVCDACRTELAELQATVRFLASLPEVRPPRSFRLEQEEAPARPPVLRFLPVVRALSVAAVIVFLVASGALYLGDAGQPGGGAPAPGETSSVSDASGEAGTTASEPAGDGRLIDQGAAASGGTDPLDDLTNLQEGPDGAAGGAAAPSGSGGTVDRLTEDYGAAAVATLGALAFVLVITWLVLARMSRRIRAA